MSDNIIWMIIPVQWIQLNVRLRWKADVQNNLPQGVSLRRGLHCRAWTRAILDTPLILIPINTLLYKLLLLVYVLMRS